MDNEQNESMEELMTYVCDNLCRHPFEAVEEDQLEEICNKCRLEQLTLALRTGGDNGG